MKREWYELDEFANNELASFMRSIERQQQKAVAGRWDQGFTAWPQFGPANVMSKVTLNTVGGWDERFESHGYDDLAMFYAFEALAGPTHCIDGPLYHLYHLPGDAGDHLTEKDRAAIERNKERFARYHQIRAAAAEEMRPAYNDCHLTDDQRSALLRNARAKAAEEMRQLIGLGDGRTPRGLGGQPLRAMDG